MCVVCFKVFVGGVEFVLLFVLVVVLEYEGECVFLVVVWFFGCLELEVL